MHCIITIMNKKIIYILKLLISVIFTFSIEDMVWIIFYNKTFLHTISFILVFLVLLKSNLKDVLKDKIVLAIGILFSLFFFVGYQVVYIGHFSFGNILTYIYIINNAIVFSCFVYKLYEFKINSNEYLEKVFSKNYVYIIIFAMIFISFFICLQGMYPGIFDPDNGYQWWMYENNSFSSQHPIFHTLFLGYFIKLGMNLFGNYTDAIAFLTIIQITMCSFLLVVLIYKLVKYKFSKLGIISMVLFICLNPLISLNFITLTKDAIFTCFLLLFSAELYNLFSKKDVKSNYFEIVFYGIMCSLLRNNFIYALILVFIILIAFKNVELINKGMILLTIVSSILIINILNYKYDVTPVPSREYLAIPIQQMGRLYSIDNYLYTEEEDDMLNKYFENGSIKNYLGYCADTIKYGMNDDFFRNNKDYFFKLWIQKGIKHPTVYINAFLELTVHAWYPDIYIHPWSKAKGAVLIMQPETMQIMTNSVSPGETKSKNTVLNEYYYFFAHDANVFKIPIIAQTQYLGVMNWIFILYLGYSLRKDFKKGILQNLIIICYYATLLGSPVVYIRYYLFALILAPFWLFNIVES